MNSSFLRQNSTRNYLHFAPPPPRTPQQVRLARPLRPDWPSRHGMRQTLQGSFSAVSKQNFASKYAFESSRRDLHNALLCTALQSQFFVKKLPIFFAKVCKIQKIQQKFGKIWQILRNFQQFLTKILRLENGAKECIVQISARAFQRVFTCKIWLRYSRERALKF